MKILFWCEQYWPAIGGLQVISERLMSSMVERGHEVMVVTSHSSLELPDDEVYHGVTVRRERFHQALSSGDIDQLLAARAAAMRAKREFQPDIVHVGMLSGAVFFHIQTLAAHRCPTLVTRQGGLPPGFAAGADTALGQMIRSADWIACCSAAMREETLAIVPEVEDRMSLVPNALVPPETTTPLPDGPPRLVVLGRLSEEKGVDIAVDAMPAILESVPDARLIIAGDGPERGPLAERAANLGVTDSIEFTGWIEPGRVPDLMKTATAVLVPSRLEAFGLVALEAAVAARPVVASDAGGLPEVVEDGRTGRIVPREDPAALAAATVELLGDRETMERFGAAGREHGVQFGWESYVDAYESLYERLTSGAPAPA